MTSGVTSTAAQLMMVSVYGVDDALCTVRLHAGSSVEGMRSGYRQPNTNTTTETITEAVAANAQPSPPRLHTSITAPSWATTATPSTSQVQSLPCASCVHR